MAEQVLAEEQAFSLKDLAVNGDDLRAMGMAPGPEMGILLDRLLDDVIADRLPNERNALLAKASLLLAQ